MGGFDKQKVALSMRDVIRQIARDEVERLRPRYRYATVVEIDEGGVRARVTFAEQDEPIWLPVWGDMPAVDDLVRIEGIVGDRYVATGAFGTVTAAALWQIVDGELLPIATPRIFSISITDEVGSSINILNDDGFGLIVDRSSFGDVWLGASTELVLHGSSVLIEAAVEDIAINAGLGAIVLAAGLQARITSTHVNGVALYAGSGAINLHAGTFAEHTADGDISLAAGGAVKLQGDILSLEADGSVGGSAPAVGDAIKWDGSKYVADAAGGPTITEYASGVNVWTPQPTSKVVKVRLWGGGGQGGGGASGSNAANRCGGSGGGGGAFVERTYQIAELTTPVTVTVGAGGSGAGAGGGTGGANGTDGAAGGNTSFGAYATAFGGGGGSLGTTAAQSRTGGGGGGSASAGLVGFSSSFVAGGGPGPQTIGVWGMGESGGHGFLSTVGGSTERGGAGGGGIVDVPSTGGTGGTSILGGGGGGGAGSGGNNQQPGGAGGATGPTGWSNAGGGGGAAGTAGGNAGTAGGDGDTTRSGRGGGGGGGSNSSAVSGGVGGAGGARAGGGGGGGATVSGGTAVGGAGGAGGTGYVEIIEW